MDLDELSIAVYEKDALVRKTFYGFRVHIRLCWPGVLTRFGLVPSQRRGTRMVPDLAEQTTVADRNYWKPSLAAELLQVAIALLAPERWASRDPTHKRSACLSRIRYRSRRSLASW